MTSAAIGLGANLGDQLNALRRAVAGLSALAATQLVGVSGLWRSAPVGGPDQPDYLNAVVIIETGLAPGDLLAACQAMEAEAGRVRDIRWGPRTLDVDILDVEGVRMCTDDLVLPHPRAHLRAFVLAPWCQLAAQWQLVDAASGRSQPVAAWLAEVDDQQLAPLDRGQWWL